MDVIERTSELFKARFLSPDYSGDDKAEYCACYLQAEREVQHDLFYNSISREFHP